MSIHINTEITLDHRFEPRGSRHTLNGHVVVLHCHHYASLYTQLANDCGLLDARALLAECAEDAIYPMLQEYFTEHGLDALADRISIAEQYYGVMGLGSLSITEAGEDGGEARLTHSHIDEGWKAKWGTYAQPINFITQGYLAATFAAIYHCPVRSFVVNETASIVAGADQSVFAIARQ